MPDELKSTAEGESAKSGKKKFPLKMALIGVILIGIIGGGGLYIFKGGKSSSSPAVAAKKTDSVSVLVAMDPFILNLADPGRFLKMTLQFEVTNAAGGQLVAMKKPQLRDAIITLLGSKTVDDITSADGKMQLKDEMILRANQALGQPVVKNVYFTEFVMQ